MWSSEGDLPGVSAQDPDEKLGDRPCSAKCDLCGPYGPYSAIIFAQDKINYV